MFLLPDQLLSADVIRFFFFNDTATTEIYTLSLHDALPISLTRNPCQHADDDLEPGGGAVDRKSTRLNSSHVKISYAVFCLTKKTKHKHSTCTPDSAKTAHSSGRHLSN